MSETKVSAGLFITLEGGEGSGKSVQCAKLCDRLKQHFSELLTVKTREPGGSPGAESIRQILLTGETDRWLPVSELLLFYAARYDHWKRTILPALERGGVVVCDRFFDSSIVYQGYARGLPESFFDAIHKIFDEAEKERCFVPDRTYILDIDPVEGVARSNRRISSVEVKEDRFERINMEFHQKVREGYFDILRKNSARCKKIDASRSIEDIHEDIWEDAVELLARHH
ncbi:MAG: dTMP kinase [Holosporales bacterium]|jgi:dTMP kinase|nr:dTMP kinase [Holosporales bacterium]